MLRADIKGGKQSAYHIDFLLSQSANWAVIHDLRIELHDRVAQIDHTLIILSDKKGPQGNRILASLNNGKTIIADAQKQTEANAARLCSIYVMTGLEVPIVFILGATDLLQIETISQSRARRAQRNRQRQHPQTLHRNDQSIATPCRVQARRVVSFSNNAHQGHQRLNQDRITAFSPATHSKSENNRMKPEGGNPRRRVIKNQCIELESRHFAAG